MPRKTPAKGRKKTSSGRKLGGKPWAVIATLIFVALTAFVLARVLVDSPKIQIADAEVTVDVADDEPERQQGLSGRENLGADQGMWFMFEQSDRHGIWMKDMKFAIDAVWVNESLKVVAIQQDLSPDTYPQTYQPNDPALYVLELPAGFAKAHGIKIGDSVHPDL